MWQAAHPTGSPPRLYSSTGSLILHAAIVVTLAAGSYLSVEPLARPEVGIQFVDYVPPPPRAAAAPPLPPSGGAKPGATETRRTVRLPPTVQPVQQPPDPPDNVTSSGAGSPEGTGAGDGVEGGEEGGMNNGIPGGTGHDPNGVPGGDPFGVPGGALNDLPGEDEPPKLISGDVTPPERTLFVRPDYPEAARLARVEGKVILEVVVGRSGDVEEVRLLRSRPLFDRAAIEAVTKWKYRPALQHGRSVRVYLTVVVDFRLE